MDLGTWIGEGGHKHPGAEMIGRLWDRALDASLGENRRQSQAAILGEVEHWCAKRPNGADILAEFHHLATPAA